MHRMIAGHRKDKWDTGAEKQLEVHSVIPIQPEGQSTLTPESVH